ncbi:Uncharacterised protein [Vibrio cholerae]|nr:Uncharacterised protein [Vibrio cholerae]CSC07486.1 Uncharacterised protein [Vibrio cholerae]CSC15602.1 Uncharacterised protein [Vibrio cholerae]
MAFVVLVTTSVPAAAASSATFAAEAAPCALLATSEDVVAISCMAVANCSNS